MKADVCLKFRINLLLILSVLFISASAVHGATRTWDGSSSVYWSTAANWVENVRPVDGDYLVFPSSASNKSMNNNLIGLSVHTIEVKGTGYVFNGNRIGLTDSIRINTTYLTLAYMHMDIVLEDDAQIRMMGYNNHLLSYGDIDIGSYDLRVGNYGLVRLYGVVSGSGSVVKFGSGTVSFNGSSANTYAGLTTVEAGTLELDQVSGNSIPRDLVIEDGATVQQEAFSRIGDDVTINGSGTYDMNGFSETIGDLILNDGADFDSGSSTLTISGEVTVDGGISSISGKIALWSGNRDFNILYNGLTLWPGAHCYLNATVSGSGSLIKKGPGDMRISGNNTYTGTTLVEGGDIMIESSTALGSSAGGTTVNAGSRIYISAFSSGISRNIIGETLSLGGALYSYGPLNSWTGDITLTDDVEIRVTSGDSLDLAGVISGSGGITKNWTGTLVFSGATANSYAGDTMVNEGMLLLNKAGYNAIRNGSLTIGDGTGVNDSVIVRMQKNYQIWDTVDITINSDGWLDCWAYADTVGAITLEGGRAGSSTGTLRLGGSVTVNSASSESVLDGKVYMGSGTRTFDVAEGSVGYELRITAVLSGAGLMKTGPGLMALQGANTYSGQTTVSEGRVYVLNDNAFGAVSGGTTVGSSGFIQMIGSDVGLEPLTLGRTDAGHVLYGRGSWAGNVVLTENASMGSNGTLEFSGGISGTGSITLTGGNFEFSGTPGNSFVGDTIVEGGTLLMNKTSGYAVSRSLVIGGNDVGDPAAEVQQDSLDEINLDVTINASGTYDMNGYSEAIRDLNLNNGADHNSGAAILTVRGDVNVDPGTTTLTSGVYGRLGVSSGYCNLSVEEDGRLWLASVVSGSEDIRKEGEGLLELTGSNTFTGAFTINEGDVILRNDLGLGSTAGGTFVNDDGVLGLTCYRVAGEHLTLDQHYTPAPTWGVASFKCLRLGGSVWTGDIVLLSDASIVATPLESVLDLSGSISGAGGLVHKGPGGLYFSGSTANSYTGDTVVEGGRLTLKKTMVNGSILGNLELRRYPDSGDVKLENTSQISSNTRVTIGTSCLFDMNDINDSIGSLTGSGAVDMGSGILSVVDDSSAEFSGLIAGSGRLQKNGSGTFTLSGNNTYSGSTLVFGGTLEVNGSQPSSDVIVYSAGTLSGIGSVGAISSSGVVAPGNSAGELSSANATLQPGSTFEVELNGYTSVDYDQLDVNGTVALNNPNLDIQWGFVPAVGDAFTIVDNDGGDAVSGTFNGLAEGASVVVGNVTLAISYVGGTGNDIVLATTAVTELESLMITSIEEVGGDIRLEWIGGVPYYVVEKKTALTNATWTAVTTPTRDMDATVPADTTNGFYRVTGGN